MSRIEPAAAAVRPAFLALSAIGFIASAPLEAHTTGQPDSEKGVELKGVTVTDSAVDTTGYKAEAHNGKLVAPLVDTPRSIVVIGEQVIKETGSASLADALRMVPGITFGAAEGGNPIGDRPFIRGFDSQGSTYVDGVRSIGAQTREVFAIEQIQVVRGSDSTLGGRGSAGGTINIVTKTPETQDFYRVDGSAGTSAYKRVTFDVNKVLSPMVAVRIAGMWHDQDVAGRDAIWQKRWGIAPSIALGLGTPTRLTFDYYHLHTNELPDSGLPYSTVCTATVCNAPTGTSIDYPVSVGPTTTLGGLTGKVSPNTFYGLVDRDFRKTNSDELTFRAEHDFGSAVMLRNTARFDHTWQGYIYTQPDDSNGNVVGTTTANTGTNLTNGGYVWRRANTRQGVTDTWTDQIDLTAKFRTGIARHSIAAGLEYDEERARRGTYVTPGYVSATGTLLLSSGSTISPRCNSATVARSYCTSLFTPNYSDPWTNYTTDTSNVPAPISKSPSYADIINKGNTKAAYAFDSIEFGKRFILNLGVRYDDFRSSVSPAQTSATAQRTTFSRRDTFWTYQAAGIFKPTDESSLYVTYATSVIPPNSLIGEGQEQDALTTTTTSAATVATSQAATDVLKTEKSKTLEVGGKIDLFQGRLALNADVFRTETTNARVTVDAGTVAFVGKKRAQGFEIGFNGNITKEWSIFGGYSYLDATIRDGGLTALTVAANGAAPATTAYVTSVNTGKQFPQTAKNNFTVWTNYLLTKRFSIGGGAFYSSRVYGGYGNNAQASQTPAGVLTVTQATSTILRAVPGYWRFDARVGAKLTDQFDLSININNLTDKRYFSQAYTTHYATEAPGRSAFVTLSFKY
jgi:catecholate siderophore receptor